MRTIKLTIFMFAAIVMSSCDKTENIGAPGKLSSNKTENKILNFAKTLSEVKSGEKSGDETMGLEEAKWNIEAALNYYNVANYTEDYVEFLTEKIEIDIDPVNEELTFDQITAIVQQMNDQINDDPDKKLAIADIYFVTKVNGELAIAMTAKKLSIINNYQFDSEDDYWSFYDENGYCDGPNVGQSTDIGSTQKLEDHVNQFAFGGWKHRFIGYYYTNIELDPLIYPVDDTYLNVNDLIPGNFNLDFMLFFDMDTPNNPETEVDLCLDPVEMNYYAQNGIPSAITLNKPVDKEMVDTHVFPAILEDQATGVNTYFHVLSVTYGTKNPQLTVPEPWSP